MIDLIAAVSVIAGGILAVLAGIGLLRFPDVFTRIHAATKSATVGVILTTLAAAIKAGSAGSAGVLLLVIALLFLSSPLGTSLLARAAYHDPETPRASMDRDDLAAVGRVPERVAADLDRGEASLLLGWLVVVWIVLFSSASPGVVAGAVLVGASVAFGLPGFRPRWPRGLFRPVASLRLAGAFALSVVMSNVDVIRAVLARRPPRPAIVRVPVRVRTRTEVTLLMNAISFTPGTLAVELHDRELYVHVLDLDDVTAFVREVERLEWRIVQAFGTPGEREAADRSGFITDRRPDPGT